MDICRYVTACCDAEQRLLSSISRSADLDCHPSAFHSLSPVGKKNNPKVKGECCTNQQMNRCSAELSLCQSGPSLSPVQLFAASRQKVMNGNMLNSNLKSLFRCQSNDVVESKFKE